MWRVTKQKRRGLEDLELDRFRIERETNEESDISLCKAS